jgi:hypothetical protein
MSTDKTLLTRAWPYHGEVDKPIERVENVYDAVAFNVPSGLITGSGFGNIDINQAKCGGALKGLIEIVTTAVTRSMEGPPKSGLPGMPPHPPPNVEGFYEVVRGDTREAVGYRLILVSHTQDYYFGDAIDDLLFANSAELAKTSRGGMPSQRAAAQQAESEKLLRNKGEGMSRHVNNRMDLFTLLSKALRMPRSREAENLADQFPLRLDSNPICPSVTMGLARAIEADDWGQMPAGRPCEHQRSIAQYLSTEVSGRNALSTASSMAPTLSAAGCGPAISGVAMPRMQASVEGLLASVAGRRPAGAPSSSSSAVITADLLMMPGGAAGGPPDPVAQAAAAGPHLTCKALTFPDPTSVWWVPKNLLGRLWEYTRPDKCAPDPNDMAAMAHLTGSTEGAQISTNEMRSMATLDLVLAMALKNEHELEDLRATARSPADYKAALIGWKACKVEEFMTFFRTADAGSITPEMDAMRGFYERMMNTGPRTLVRKFTDIDPSLDALGNFIAYMRTFSDHVLRNYATHAQLELIWLSCFNAYHWNPYKLQWSGLIPGDSGVSKSFTMLLIKKMMITGTVQWLTTRTNKARETAGNYNDSIIFCDEAASEVVSEKNGMRVDDNPAQKSAMTSGIVIKEINVARADGSRTTITISIPSMCVHWNATNNTTHHMSDPIQQRTMVTAFPSLSREGAFDNSSDEFIQGEWLRDEVCEDAGLERFHILQLLVFLVENLIKIHVLTDVDVKMCQRFDLQLYKELMQSGVPVNRRDIERFNMNCREGAIVDAAIRLFLCTGSPISDGEPWSDKNLLMAEPLLVVSESTAAYVLGLHCMVLVPQDGQALLRHAVTVSSNVVPASIDVCSDDTIYMPEAFAEQLASNGAKIPSPPGGGEAAAAGGGGGGGGGEQAGQFQQQQQQAPPVNRRTAEAIDAPRLQAPDGDGSGAPARRQCRVNRFDWIRLNGPLSALAERIHKHMPDPRPPLAIISTYLHKLSGNYILVRNRDPNGTVITDVSAFAARGTMDHWVESNKAGLHEVAALICDPSSRMNAPIYIAQDLLASRSMSAEDVVTRTLTNLCHRYTRPRRVVVGLPLVVRGVDSKELVRLGEGFIKELEVADMRTGAGSGSPDPSSPSSSRSSSASAMTTTVTSAHSQAPSRKFPQLSQVAHLEPGANKAERVVVNPLTEEIRKVLYTFPGDKTETERAWENGTCAHVMEFNHDIESDIYMKRLMGLAISQQHTEILVRLFPFLAEKIAPKVCRLMGYDTIAYPSDLVRGYLRVERTYRDPGRSSTIVDDIIPGLATIDTDAIAAEVVKRIGRDPRSNRRSRLPQQQQQQAAAAPQLSKFRAMVAAQEMGRKSVSPGSGDDAHPKRARGIEQGEGCSSDSGEAMDVDSDMVGKRQRADQDADMQAVLNDGTLLDGEPQ